MSVQSRSANGPTFKSFITPDGFVEGEVTRDKVGLEIDLGIPSRQINRTDHHGTVATESGGDYFFRKIRPDSSLPADKQPSERMLTALKNQFESRDIDLVHGSRVFSVELDDEPGGDAHLSFSLPLWDPESRSTPVQVLKRESKGADSGSDLEKRAFQAVQGTVRAGLHGEIRMYRGYAATSGGPSGCATVYAPSLDLSRLLPPTSSPTTGGDNDIRTFNTDHEPMLVSHMDHFVYPHGMRSLRARGGGTGVGQEGTEPEIVSLSFDTTAMNQMDPLVRHFGPSTVVTSRTEDPDRATIKTQGWVVMRTRTDDSAATATASAPSTQMSAIPDTSELETPKAAPTDQSTLETPPTLDLSGVSDGAADRMSVA
ncbi:hypothetical protein I317_06505 [Kwoniella heveanensis CBS 569]|nr:hypothetical protein I317_06505 [Kwoniella heveanensis CBS 569]